MFVVSTVNVGDAYEYENNIAETKAIRVSALQ
jgi:hypothetical protein